MIRVAGAASHVGEPTGCDPAAIVGAVRCSQGGTASDRDPRGSRRKALMDKPKFNLIRRGLHPDSRNSISDKMLAEAFDAFMSLEKYLLNERDSPTEFGDLPDSLDAWDKMRKQKPRSRSRQGVVRR